MTTKLRLDKKLCGLNQGITRTKIQKAIKAGHVSVNGMIINDCALMVNENDDIRISNINKFDEDKYNNSHISPTDIPLHIVYEDEHLIVVNKQAGLTTHPSGKNVNYTLVNALLYHKKSLSNYNNTMFQIKQYNEEDAKCIDNTRALTEEVMFKNGTWYNSMFQIEQYNEGSAKCIDNTRALTEEVMFKNGTWYNSIERHNNIERPGIVHRLDKDTSGLMIVAKTNEAHLLLSSAIAARLVTRKYKAIVWGVFSKLHGSIETMISRDKVDRKKMTVSKTIGKKAISHYNTEKIFHNGLCSLVECTLETGRTHQIRVHFSHLGHSIIGDQTYGKNFKKATICNSRIKDLVLNLKRQALHSFYIGFTHPIMQNYIEFTSSLPYDMQSLIEGLESV